MKFLRLLKNDFQRAVFSYSFLVCALMATFLIVSSAATQIGYVDTLMGFLRRGMQGNGMETVLRQILPLIPFGMSFANEWNENAYRFYVSRVGPERYILSKIIITCVSGFLVLSLGAALAIPVLRVLFPEYPIVDIGYPNFTLTLFQEGKVVLAYTAWIVNYALTTCFSSICAVWLSTYIPNPLAVLASPTLIYFTIIRIGTIYKIPGLFDKYIFFNPIYWMNATYNTQLARVEIGYHLGNVLIIFVILSFFAVRKTKRRVLNG